MEDKSNDIEIIILSGYQMLRETLADGTKGSERIDCSVKTIEKWQSDKSEQLIHLEMASTQDRKMRKYLLDTLAGRVDSLGFNERELIDLLEVIGEDVLAGRCEEDTCSANLYEGMLKVYAYTGVPRMQLHMFGLYLTMQKPEFIISPEKNRDGMQLAAVIAASKAGTGSINSSEVLLWAKDKAVSETGLSELKSLSDHIGKNSDNQLITEGIFRSPDFDLIAVPTILIDKPVTLVGMGDTISSISLVAAR
jgi:ADP-dependent phosphofructokinase/glucokinase